MTISAIAPPAITAAANMLAASATWIALVGAPAALTSIYYPAFDQQETNSPAAVIFPGRRTKTKFIVGAPGLDGGMLTIVIYLPITMTDDVVEVFGENILKDLLANDTGLAIQDSEVSTADEPRPGERAADGNDCANGARVITLTINYGLHS